MSQLQDKVTLYVAKKNRPYELNLELEDSAPVTVLACVNSTKSRVQISPFSVVYATPTVHPDPNAPHISKLRIGPGFSTFGFSITGK